MKNLSTVVYEDLDFSTTRPRSPKLAKLSLTYFSY